MQYLVRHFLTHKDYSAISLLLCNIYSAIYVIIQRNMCLSVHLAEVSYHPRWVSFHPSQKIYSLVSPNKFFEISNLLTGETLWEEYFESTLSMLHLYFKSLKSNRNMLKVNFLK